MTKFGTVGLSLKIAFLSETPCIIKTYVKDIVALMNTYLKDNAEKMPHRYHADQKLCSKSCQKQASVSQYW